MILTEAEAKGKWCPFVRYLATFRGADGRLDTAGCFNRGGADSGTERALCIASACMAWRWQPSASMDNPRRLPGAGVQEIKRERGYCGLAGSS